MVWAVALDGSVVIVVWAMVLNESAALVVRTMLDLDVVLVAAVDELVVGAAVAALPILRLSDAMDKIIIQAQ